MQSTLPPGGATSAFAVLSFLAAPAILTNACTLLALGTSNRLARAADRARLAAAAILAATDTADPMVKLQEKDFHSATTRAQLLVKALRRFYFGAGCFAAGTCVALVGAFADYFELRALDRVTQGLTILAAVAGVWGIVTGALILLRETRLALEVLETHHAAITRWRATRAAPPVPPTV
jgi:hypothetical protein